MAIWNSHLSLKMILSLIIILVTMIISAETSELLGDHASVIFKSMNSKIDPCDDFYNFACGKFLSETIIPNDKVSVDTFNTINDHLLEQLNSIITEAIRPNELKPVTYAKHIYKACMNECQIEADVDPLKTLFHELGGWPVLEGDKWNEAAFTWEHSVYKFRDAGFSVDYFIDFSVYTDVKNTTTHIIYIDQASLGQSREYLTQGLDDKRVAAYFVYMQAIAVLLGANETLAKRELEESLKFEMKLANISLPKEERRNQTALYNPMNIAELQRRFPSIPWFEYMTKILPQSVTLKHDEIVIVEVPTYISQLEALLSKTPKRIQANYVMWRAAKYIVSYLPKVFREQQLEYYTTLSGETEHEPRWKECIDISKYSLPFAVGSLYVGKYFNKDARANAVEIVNGIREEMYKILETVDWMDEETRKSAIEKAKLMSVHVGYPDELLDDSKLLQYYDGLAIDNTSYFEAMLNLNKFYINFYFKRLRQPVDKTEWIRHGQSAEVNGFYHPLDNAIEFPAGILQGAFFSKDRSKYMNYGGIGFVIGHEITHGFDDEGCQCDKDGNLVNWWTESTKEAFLVKASCIIHQYGNYTSEEVKLQLNGIHTQGENIADNGGIKLAYRAYNTWVQSHEAEPGLRGYSPQQMFWLSAANTWCSSYRPEWLKDMIMTDCHSPAQFRINGAFSNQKDFARDFNCPVGSKMNPREKCIVW